MGEEVREGRIPETGRRLEWTSGAKGQTNMVDKDKYSGTKGSSEAGSEARDWEVLRVVLEWGSGDFRKTKGGAASENSTGTMAGARSMVTLGTGKTVEKLEVI